MESNFLKQEKFNIRKTSLCSNYCIRSCFNFIYKIGITLWDFCALIIFLPRWFTRALSPILLRDSPIAFFFDEDVDLQEQAWNLVMLSPAFFKAIVTQPAMVDFFYSLWGNKSPSMKVFKYSFRQAATQSLCSFGKTKKQFMEEIPPVSSS